MPAEHVFFMPRSMINHLLATQIKKNFAYRPTVQQEFVVDSLSAFFANGDSRSLLLLKGYAGTGKTTLLSAFVRALDENGIRCVLLAPTGRAAKVFARYANHPAYTIHRRIYHQDGDGDFCLAQNNTPGQLFIVDEASMIGCDPYGMGQGGGNLLDDLITYVYSGQNCRLILLGDVAQLPPVGQEDSPALSRRRLEGYGLDVTELLMTEVVRQGEASGVLHNATNLRTLLDEGRVDLLPRIRFSGFSDIIPLDGQDLMDVLERCYEVDGQDETIVITRSNKRANLYNNGIRSRILYREEELESGDIIMIARNNYYWTREIKRVPFLANGEMARVRRAGRRHELYGCHFQEAELELLGYEGEILIANVMLDTLQSDTPNLTREQREALFNEFRQDYPELTSKTQIYQAARKDPFLNALQVKYAYAITCHKAQGGQWRNVILDHGYLSDDQLGRDYYRWLYTAVTRATGTLYMVNYPKDHRD